MIISRTPFRISFAGGGSDLDTFYRKHEGCVLSASINRYMYIMVHPSFQKEKTIIKYKKTEEVTSIKKIIHPIARQILLDYNISGIELASIADVPAGTGLASSSAYTVGVLHALSAYIGKYRSQEWLAKRACEIEIEELNERIGKQDQYGCSIGGIKFIRFLPNGTVLVEPIILEEKIQKELEENLLMFYVGNIRSASQILKEQSENNAKEEQFNNLVAMTELAYELKETLEDGKLDSFGTILNKGWELKRKLATQITNPEIDKFYDVAINNGAKGGKLLGAGGGGFLLFYCEKEEQKKLRSALYQLTEMPFKFDLEGSKIIHVGNKDWE